MRKVDILENSSEDPVASPHLTQQETPPPEKSPSISADPQKKCRGAGKNKELREQLLKTFFSTYTPTPKPPQNTTRCNNCKSCLDGYCQCFNNGFFCDGRCGCQTCENQAKSIEKIRAEKIQKEKRKLKGKKISRMEDLNAYLSHYQKKENVHCNCKKNCDLKYCKCRQANQICSGKCKCTDCHNTEITEH